jgi:hypothetical protein
MTIVEHQAGDDQTPPFQRVDISCETFSPSPPGPEPRLRTNSLRAQSGLQPQKYTGVCVVSNRISVAPCAAETVARG